MDYTYVTIDDTKFNRKVTLLVDACQCGSCESFHIKLRNRKVYATCEDCGDIRQVGDLEPTIPTDWELDKKSVLC